ncbi:MAG: hypothetical protein JST29_06555 [Bacteroidetes bacterium]|nr:hypothetical protein [Bacteroidota bacterium]MBS1591055.1 hypothetical protein [Bacteroidota bacterium]
MRKLFSIALLLFISVSVFSQKKYDCIVLLKDNFPTDSMRVVGKLKQVEDSAIIVITKKGEQLFNWNDIVAVKFRKHNGFMRTVVPAVVLAAAATTIITAIEVSNSKHNGGCGCVSSSQVIVPLVFPIVTLLGLFVGTPTYFALRNKNFIISDYNSFLTLKLASKKYIHK